MEINNSWNVVIVKKTYTSTNNKRINFCQKEEQKMKLSSKVRKLQPIKVVFKKTTIHLKILNVAVLIVLVEVGPPACWNIGYYHRVDYRMMCSTKSVIFTKSLPYHYRSSRSRHYLHMRHPISYPWSALSSKCTHYSNQIQNILCLQKDFIQ